MNDNFIGFLDPWVYETDITWMEKTVATPFWTGMTLFSIDRKATHRRQKFFSARYHVYGHRPGSI